MGGPEDEGVPQRGDPIEGPEGDTEHPEQGETTPEGKPESQPETNPGTKPDQEAASSNPPNTETVKITSAETKTSGDGDDDSWKTTVLWAVGLVLILSLLGGLIYC